MNETDLWTGCPQVRKDIKLGGYNKKRLEQLVVKEFYFHSDYRKKETKSEPSAEDLEAFNAILNDPNVSF